MDAFRRKNHTLVTEADVHHQKAAAVSLAGSFSRHIAFTDVVIAFFAENDRQHHRSHSGSVREITDRQHHYMGLVPDTERGTQQSLRTGFQYISLEHIQHIYAGKTDGAVQQNTASSVCKCGLHEQNRRSGRGCRPSFVFRG
ncbi:unknown [Ruminococcus sp. CAG:382]|nr:unknown [Ruminococcus sp. CAG:382]